jgi:pyruvate formate lyase activating enzyme
MHECMLYEKLSNGTVRCDTCAHHCVIRPGSRGFCQVRENRSGALYSLVYGKAAAVNVDPVEKKPLFHFLPGSLSFSICTAGCNMRCKNCQNHSLSQIQDCNDPPGGYDIKPESIAASALEHGCKTISYTYTEPAVYFDYAYEISASAGEKGLKNIFVTNGFWSVKALKKMLPFMHGANVDLKSFRENTYIDLCGAGLKPVLDTIFKMAEAGVWLEITTLIIPDINDSEQELEEIAAFINGISPNIPWHVSRFHPAYKMNHFKRTPVFALQRARDIGLDAGLKYVYTGNIPGDTGENTTCPECGLMLIRRIGFEVIENKIIKGTCPGCKAVQAGVWC